MIKVFKTYEINTSLKRSNLEPATATEAIERIIADIADNIMLGDCLVINNGEVEVMLVLTDRMTLSKIRNEVKQ